MTSKQLWFDLDGTVADLYNTQGWLEQIESEESGLFIDLPLMHDRKSLDEICLELVRAGWQLGVITWLPMGASVEYEEQVTKEKKIWVTNNMPYITTIHCQTYGTPKQYGPHRRAKTMVLVDDNADVRATWNTAKQRISIDPNCDNLIHELMGLLTID